MNSATSQGMDMSMKIFKDCVQFSIKKDIVGGISITGGEPFMHPQIFQMIEYACEEVQKLFRQGVRTFITVLTNGERLQDNSIAEKLKQLLLKYTFLSIQVTNDRRFYSRAINLNLPIFQMSQVVVVQNIGNSIYPKGRAVTNKIPWSAKATKCFNIRAITKQIANPTLEAVCLFLRSNNKFCTPHIRTNADIRLGETSSCPVVANIYQSDKEIVQAILDFKCDGCKQIIDKLDPVYRQFVEYK
jgi:hypothetical protein